MGIAGSNPASLTFLLQLVESGKTVRRVPFNVLELESSRVSLNVAFGGSKQFTAINLIKERVAEVEDASLLSNLCNFKGHVMRNNVQGAIPCLVHLLKGNKL